MLAVVDPSLIWLSYITMLTVNGMKISRRVVRRFLTMEISVLSTFDPMINGTDLVR